MGDHHKNLLCVCVKRDSMSTSQSATSSEKLTVPPNLTDPGWQYGDKKGPSTVVCRLCGKKTSGGISRLKKHIAHVKGDITPCPNSTEEMKRVIREYLVASEKKKSKKPARYVSTKRRKRSSSEDPSSSSDGIEFDSLPQVRHTRKLRNAGKKLDTDIFESFLEDLWSKISVEKRMSCAYFDSLWFSLYKKDHTRAKVLQWIKDKNVFSRNYTFVPIVCWNHWSLLILCHFGEIDCLRTRSPCMLLLDSLLGAEPKRLEPDIRKFVFDVFESEGRKESRKCISDIPLLIPKVPQQRNGDECGSYVLYFIYRFVESAPSNFTQQGYPYFLTEEWFTEDDFDNFSKEIETFSMSKKKSVSQEMDATKRSSPSPVQCEIHTGNNIIEID
ncbi:Sentrin-specific protease 1 [Rhynchospora pubera]|uniref:Sentrin-specific protease 1 n=1 Tax=Rhynchospora pubera TaxID=906938 RepID=A0AAV8HR91_9POAL|nr:Sentrin-specific protease 1 [Rhynchospora pubera]